MYPIVLMSCLLVLIGGKPVVVQLDIARGGIDDICLMPTTTFQGKRWHRHVHARQQVPSEHNQIDCLIRSAGHHGMIRSQPLMLMQQRPMLRWAQRKVGPITYLAGTAILERFSYPHLPFTVTVPRFLVLWQESGGMREMALSRCQHHTPLCSISAIPDQASARSR